MQKQKSFYLQKNHFQNILYSYKCMAEDVYAEDNNHVSWEYILWHHILCIFRVRIKSSPKTLQLQELPIVRKNLLLSHLYTFSMDDKQCLTA